MLKRFSLSASAIAIACLLMSFSPSEEEKHTFIYPKQSKVVVKDNILTLIMQVDEGGTSGVKVYSPWDSTFTLDLTSKTKRMNLIDEVANSMPDNLLLRKLTLWISAYHQQVNPKEVSFEFRDRIAAKALLQDTTRGIPRALRELEGLSAKLQVTGWVPMTIHIKGERDHFCQGKNVAVSAILVPGYNLIPIEFSSSQGQGAQWDTVSAYYNIELHAGPLPPGFMKEQFHTPANEANCVKCHSVSSGSASKAPQGLQCASCHGAMIRQKSVHGLLAAHDCNQCHDTKAGSGYGALYVPSHENEKCFSCHEPIKKKVRGKTFVHAPLAGGQCSICHSPHGSPNVYQLRKTVNDICYSCHDDKKEGNHPVVFHPSDGKPDPRYPEKDLSCASCHDPHAADNKNMLAMPGGYFALCQSCHNK
jgi:predicted CXXCH cytochrome family protein